MRYLSHAEVENPICVVSKPWPTFSPDRVSDGVVYVKAERQPVRDLAAGPPHEMDSMFVGLPLIAASVSACQTSRTISTTVGALD